MRVFVTGATGFVGQAVVKELIAAGHSVLGLVRSQAKADELTAAGAQAHIGNLDDLESLRSGAAVCEGVIHTAFIHDFSDFERNCRIDREAISAIGDTLAGTGKPFIITSGTAGLKPGSIAAEDDTAAPDSPAGPRKASEGIALAFAEKGVRAMVVRLPPSVHGSGDHGFVPMLIAGARKAGFAAYVGEGQNRWPAVHRLDAAKVYRLALESGTAGTAYHAVAEQGIACIKIAETIGKNLYLPVVSKTREEVLAALGFVGAFFGIDVPASGELTKERLGWQPTNIGLIEDIETGGYFNL